MRMKKTYILLLVAVMFTVSGCDFFRKIAGRPTSDVIEAKRMEMLADIQKKEIREQEIRDSIAAVKKAEQDSVETLQWLKDNGVMIIDASRFGGITADPYLDWEYATESSYRVILGSFRSRANALRLISNAEEENSAMDMALHTIDLKNGMIAVGCSPVDHIYNARLGIEEARRWGICPPGVWILKTK